jgi:hypothetical protein
VAGEGLDTAYEIATVAPKQQAEIARTVVEKRLTQKQVRSLTAEKKETRVTTVRTSNRGRPRKQKPFHQTWTASNGATITARFESPRPTAAEVIAALEDVLESLKASRKADAA